MSSSFRPHGIEPARFLCPWNSLGTNTGVGCSLFQGIVLTQGSNQGLLHFRRTLYCLSHQGSLIFCGGDTIKPTTVAEPGGGRTASLVWFQSPHSGLPAPWVSVHGALAHLPGTVPSFSQVNLLNSHESSGRWVPPLPFRQEKKLRGCTTHPGHPPGSASAGVSASQTLNRSTLLAGRALISINKMFSLRIPVSVLEASKCDWQIKVEFCTLRPQWHQTH